LVFVFYILWSSLSGVICVHKPRNVSLGRVRNCIKVAICKGVNECFPQDNLPFIDFPIVEAHPKTQTLLTVGQRKQVDYSLHPLVVGDAAVEEDLQIEALNYFEPSCSGVCLIGINDGCNSLEEITGRAWLNEYKVMGQLGRETVDNEIRGKVTRTCDYSIKLLKKLEMRYKSIALELANVEPNSQEAFELGRKGFPRPKILGSPIVFNVRLTLFKSPTFLLTLQCISETDAFIRDLVREIGISLGSTASCRRILRTHLGPFGSDHSLLDKHLSLQAILTNMTLCRRILENDITQLDQDVICKRPKNPINAILNERLTEVFDDEIDENVEDEVEDCISMPWGRNYDM
uniref:TruB_N domain-containing protein n=1 Tax=Syphacia muris TaxID=451379 RepID=A0A0N5AM95_9BILA